MKKILTAFLMFVLITAQAFSMELDFRKGFFNVPWGASAEEAIRLLGLKDPKIEKVESRYSDQCIRFEKNGIQSQLFFFNKKLICFTRSINMKDAPDSGFETWINVFTKKLNEILKDKKDIECTVSSSIVSSSFNEAPETTIETVTITVSNLKLEKEAEKEIQKARTNEKEEIIKSSFRNLMNL